MKHRANSHAIFPKYHNLTKQSNSKQILKPHIKSSRDQTLKCTENDFRPHSRGHHDEISLNSIRLGSKAGKQSPDNIGAVALVLCCVAVLAAGCVLCMAVLTGYF